MELGLDVVGVSIQSEHPTIANSAIIHRRMLARDEEMIFIIGKC
mgnify:CR=1 FL=1